MQMHRSPVRSQETAAQIGNDEGKARLVGSGPILVPARSIRVLEGSVKPAGAFPYDALRVPIQLANFSSRDV